ncbi:N-6 DNA methylase, partial [Pseudomonas syringae]|uniref:N-6 DNA methylase n=1 Tax=Pseudomonas syringae TaxID=317 RepID=UPI001F43DE22
REYSEGRAQSYLLPEHIEKIATAFDEFRQIDGLSDIVDIATLRDNSYNLNIRRYVDNAPTPEPQDVRAHLVGGIPKPEVEAKAGLFQAHVLDPQDLFVVRDERYFDFRPELNNRQVLKPAIEENVGLQAKETKIRDAFKNWWEEHSPRITALAGQMNNSNSLVSLLSELLQSFSQS